MSRSKRITPRKKTLFLRGRQIILDYIDCFSKISCVLVHEHFFEVAIATATMVFGLSSGAALSTVVGVLIEVPVMLMLVKICLGTKDWFRAN